ncbi:unnamed protein product [Ixodes pacificus]
MEGHWPCPEDTSRLRSALPYGTFVVAGLAALTVSLVATPVAIFRRLGACRQSSLCTSLERDLLASLNAEVHPCDDFYEHVCGGWDRSQAPKHTNPLVKYEASFENRVVRTLLNRKIPPYPRRSEDKASFLLLRCLRNPSRSDTAGQLASYLGALRLPWPHKTRTSRQQLLDILLQASLDFGLPAIWAFYVGRHPLNPSENTLYLELPASVGEFFRTLDALQKQGSVRRYFRRCAEILGGTGQSYSSMIDDVVEVHKKFLRLEARHYNPLRQPSYMNLSDAELRRAINGHLPDNSQLWPTDEIVNLQPKLFKAFNETFLQTAADREDLKLYVGAFVVWDLSPLAYRHLTVHMLADMKNSEIEEEYVTRRCIAALQTVMPLVPWKVESDLVKDKSAVFRELALVQRAIERHSVRYGKEVVSVLKKSAKQIMVNAFNSSATSALLDKMYEFLDITQSGSFFVIFLKASSNITAYFKDSLLTPQHNIVHLQGVSVIRLYRMLVLRESVVKSYLMAPPVTLPDHPVQVQAAVTGTELALDILQALEYSFLYDANFKELNETDIRPTGVGKYLRELVTIYRHLKVLIIGRFLQNNRVREIVLQSYATAVAFSAHGLSTTNASVGVATYAPKGFEGIPGDQLFFLVKCFTACSNLARLQRHSKMLCNIALPAVKGFNKAFGCSPSQPLAFNFSWDFA